MLKIYQGLEKRHLGFVKKTIVVPRATTPLVNKDVLQEEAVRFFSALYSLDDHSIGNFPLNGCFPILDSATLDILIFSHAGTSFRWEASPPILPTKPADDPNGAPVPPLPSMADLLLQGCSKLIENGDGEFEKYPMFRTGLGKSVALKESSIAKALSILANDDAASTVTSSKLIPANNGSGSSLFQTGSGKMVNISSAGLVRAKTLLGLEHDNENHNFEGFQHPRRLPATNEPYDCQRFSHSGKKEDLQNYGVMDVTSEPRHMLNSRNGLVGGELGSENDSTPMHSKMFDSAPKPPPIKFHTAGGRSLYEREVNHGQRSAIKKILEGDASPSKMLVLCVSTIQSNSEPNMETNLEITNGTHYSGNAKVELTDGWYSINAVLDVLLSKQLAVGKLFVGQKLRIWGAGLCGWDGPVSPLEASSAISLALNMNGTFRAHWADRLGFCKGFRIPMAFRCIKGDGGPVPLTLVGVTRIYPVLYKERLRNGGSIVRSERMESRMVQKHNQRCSVLVDHVISEYQRGVNSSYIHNDSESEGAKILRILETSAEPEVLMAEMSPEQLTSFATYKSKLEATRQLEMEKSIEKALAEAGLNERDVVPFMRVRVVGLINRNYHGKGRPKEGIITIWNPTEKQESELVEGQAYVVSGLIPMNSDSEILYLQARGSTNKWQPLSPLAMESFEAFFFPRKSMKLSNLGEISLSSEFDIAAYVVYVGEVYTASHLKKQWVFVTDDSISDLQSDSLLAISFCSPSIDDDSFAPINSNLVGSTVGFCNLIKKPKDQMNHLWVAEATENSTYYLNFKPSISHLKSAGASVQAWAKASSSIIDELRKKLKLEISVLGF
ncbi:hypothetical protein GOBAR_DD05250 [Gossypium barbadense]|nr:hypothetical protein GOBAR_DD05250 [Gossypium barbadense]